MSKKLSWKPVRRGEYYCSPACSHDGFCKYTDYLKAQKRAKLWAKRLPGFKPVVWENLGWHWCLSMPIGKGHVALHRHDRGGGWYVLAAEEGPGGVPEWGSFDVKRPEQAVPELRRRLRKAVAWRQKFLDKLEALTS